MGVSLTLFGETFLELLNATGGIDHLVLTGIERVALPTDLNFNMLLCGRNFHGISASALDDSGCEVFWVNIRFHPTHRLNAHP